MKGIPIDSRRMGSERDVKLSYSEEFWFKAKGLARDRAVLGCLLAHLQAMQTLVEGGFDMIVEDNVRLSRDAADRIWETIDASSKSQCHLRYFGWLGSLPNLKWVLGVHAKRKGVKTTTADNAPSTIFEFPIVPTSRR